MNTTTIENRAEVEARILREGYGENAWHGPDLKAALADVTSEIAFWRPGPERHNIAEIALHHAYCVRNVRAKLTGREAEPFVLEGDDWFELPNQGALPWTRISDLVAREHEILTGIVTDIGAGRIQSPLPEAERFDIVLGITCHAIYHAGQIQLIKRLR